MLFKQPNNTARAAHIGAEDNRWQLVDLEAAQRRNLYAAGTGDRPRTAHRWSFRRAKAR